VTDPPARPAPAYPARGIAELRQPAPTRHSPALARLLGRTRAALLESLAEPASTHTLARRHGLAPGTVSGHLTALHHARLITRRRHRHAVLYQQAPLGADLANGGHQPRPTAMSKAPGKQPPPPQEPMPTGHTRRPPSAPLHQPLPAALTAGGQAEPLITAGEARTGRAGKGLPANRSPQ